MNRILPLAALFTLTFSTSAQAKDFFLTIGGGYAPSGNQASLEKNVLFFQRLLKEQGVQPQQQTLYFADGSDPANDLQVQDAASVPKANRLMAEFFGEEQDLGLTYRNHNIPGVRGATTTANIRRWFNEVGKTMRTGDRLILYVTSHGERSEDRDNAYQTAISLWNGEKLKVSELVTLLDTMPEGTSVVTVMVQCYTGGFARIIFNDGDPEKGVSKQSRCGFYATVHDRTAAGCTPDVDKDSYVEYSSYFWAALGGRTQTGETAPSADYDKNSVVTFDEAHAYTVLKADTVDLPIKTSGEFLSVESQFRDNEHPDLLPEDPPFEQVYELATPAERAIFDALSQELTLEGPDRLAAAERETQGPRRNRRRPGGPRSASQRAGQLREKIANDVKAKWPELANVLNPKALELLSSRSREFIQAIEQHPSYKEYLEQKEAAEKAPDPQKRRVKFERFLTTADDVIMRENLKRLGDEKKIAQYQAIAAAEASSLRPLATPAPAPAQAIPATGASAIGAAPAQAK